MVKRAEGADLGRCAPPARPPSLVGILFGFRNELDVIGCN